MSFIETSALDASNVESAFQTILTGKHPLKMIFTRICTLIIFPDIYRIVSSKSLEQSADPINPAKETFVITPTDDSKGAAQSSKCC